MPSQPNTAFPDDARAVRSGAPLLTGTPDVIAPVVLGAGTRCAGASSGINRRASPEDALDATTTDALDRLLHACEARWTGSLSPESLILAFWDWSLHLANAPGRRLVLAQEAAHRWARLACPGHWIEPSRGDHRFLDKSWSEPPFNFI